MKSAELNRQHQKLTALFNKVNTACGADLELQAHWARYICILSAGFLENSISEIYGEYVKQSSSPHVANYCKHTLSKVKNPNVERFLQVAGGFKNVWRSDLEAYLQIDGRGDAINSIMSNRHLIAHGNSSGITLTRIKEYLGKSVQVLEYIEQQCGL